MNSKQHRHCVSDLDLHCLFRSVCPNTYGKYSISCLLFDALHLHGIKVLMLYANSDGPDERAHPYSLI